MSLSVNLILREALAPVNRNELLVSQLNAFVSKIPLHGTLCGINGLYNLGNSGNISGNI